MVPNTEKECFMAKSKKAKTRRKRNNIKRKRQRILKEK
jgi:hypothetical protein